ncbi:MAG: RNA-binding protein [Bauldia sp.]|nr:RNA-binding protein [Bauldia sp.]
MAKEAAETRRMCILTREIRPVEELIRFVVDPDGIVVPDLSRKLPGHGVWLTAERERLAEAERKHIFRKAFAADVAPRPGLEAEIVRLYTERALGALGLARKAGLVLTGFAKVSGAISSGKAVAVLHASDASADGIRKLQAMARHNPSIFTDGERFTSAQLSLSLGGTNVIHAALLAGRPSEIALQRIAALTRLMSPATERASDNDPFERNAADPAQPKTA